MTHLTSCRTIPNWSVNHGLREFHMLSTPTLTRNFKTQSNERCNHWYTTKYHHTILIYRAKESFLQSSFWKKFALLVVRQLNQSDKPYQKSKHKLSAELGSSWEMAAWLSWAVYICLNRRENFSQSNLNFQFRTNLHCFVYIF